MSRAEIFIAIVGMIVLEIYHLKWIWWENWICRDCGVQHKHCSCEPRWWFKYF
jgi:hypothetical protein